MLEIKNIKKNYQTGDFIQQALKGVDIKFRPNEFVAILGASGSGKTTLLNILGGLDSYDEGDLLINNLSTKNFKSKDWDAYRNNCVGFIFQSYNLISHISIVNNIEMTMTLSNVSKKIRRRKALAALEKVGLKEHAHKRPNQLSGGQMQRVAIARALVNDPEIILADEPTGALDSATSVQIMEMIKDIAKDKLVIMVTHNQEIATDYASRIIELKDGEIVSDSKPYNKVDKEAEVSIKKTKMSFLTAMSLSFNNILTKKGRTFITSLASSIGIIGIALILSLSNGFDIQIDNFEKDTLSNMPIMITEQAMSATPEEMKSQMNNTEGVDEAKENKEIIPLINFQDEYLHTNVITQDYIDFVENLDSDKVNGIAYTRATGLNLINKVEDKVSVVDTTYFMTLPMGLDGNESGVMKENFVVLNGKLPKEANELLIIINKKNQLPEEVLSIFGYGNDKNIKYNDLVGKTIQLVNNNDYYQNMGNVYIPNFNLDSLYNNKNNETLTVVGVATSTEDNVIYGESYGVIYSDKLIEQIVENNKDSNMVKAQKEADYNIMSGEKFTEDEKGITQKEQMLAYLGSDALPMMVQIFPVDFASKEYILDELDKYNEKLDEEDQILYTDLGAMLTELSSGIMDGITIVLVAFSAISLIVSSIMIGIITYISVLERTKEIGILRSLGARKKDITRVFNAETTIIGLFSGFLGIFIAWILLIPTNKIIYNLTELKNVGILDPIHALILITVSFILTIIGGALPAYWASKKDPVEALRTE